MPIINKFQVKCEKCGNTAEIHVVADGFDDAPARFTVTRTCGGGCSKTYTPLTAQQMNETFKLPMVGWEEAKF